MRKKMPPMTESAAELLRRMKSEPDLQKQQRVHALDLVASGHAQPRQDVAAALGVHRHSVAAWFAAYAAGGLAQALRYDVPRPTRARRMTDTARAALMEQLRPPAGCARYGHIRTWVAEPPPVHWSYSSVYALVRGALHAKPTRPRPSQAKNVRRP